MAYERLLCVDLGTKMGWAFWSPETGETSGWCDLGAWPLYAPRAAQFSKWWTWAVRTKWDPDLIVIEEPFMSRPQLSITARHWMHYTYVRSQELVTAMAKTGWDGVMDIRTPGSFKKHATGGGRANKKMVKDAVNKNKPGRNIKSEDEADAVAMLDMVRQEYKIGSDAATLGRQFLMTELVA